VAHGGLLQIDEDRNWHLKRLVQRLNPPHNGDVAYVNYLAIDVKNILESRILFM